jgi:uncharacterized protein
MSDPSPGLRAGAPCPICHRPSTADMRPFCSKRCADVDLHRWLSEAYRVPDSAVDRDGDDAQTHDHPDWDQSG